MSLNLLEFDQNWRLAIEFAPEKPSIKWLEKSSGQFGEEACRFASQQGELRRRARQKFSQCAAMVFTKEGLEQASSEVVSQFHASHFPARRRVLDGTCGIGGDALALASRGEVHGYDLDELRLKCAHWNANALGRNFELHLSNSLEATGFEYVWFDPGRRDNGTRIRNLQDYQPNPVKVREALAEVKLGGMKLSPMELDEDLARLGERIEFISHRGQCLEACVWWGSEVGQGDGLERGIWACHLESGELVEASSLGIPEVVERAGKFLFDLDPALIRAHGTHLLGLPSLGDRPGYVTGSANLNSVWAKGFEVICDQPFDMKRLRSTLSTEGLCPKVIKSRSRTIRPEELLPKLHNGCPHDCTLIFYEVQRSVRVAICQSTSA